MASFYHAAWKRGREIFQYWKSKIRKIPLWGKVLILFLAGLFLVASLFVKTYYSELKVLVTFTGDFFNASTLDLKNTDGRTNILILGVGGASHETPDLTDTVIFASFGHKADNHLLLSLPRDIWVPSMRAKLNTAYYYGNLQDGNGEARASQVVSEILGQPIHYTVVVSFDVFVETVDLLGGIDVMVDRSLLDERYPVPGRETDDCEGDPGKRCRYETISFNQGLQHLDGQQALKFARSRNAEGDEGTDFARAARQQKIMVAVRKKLLSPSFFLNPENIRAFVAILNERVKTDIDKKDYPAMAKLALHVKRGSLRSEVLDGIYAGKEGLGLLYNPPVLAQYDKQWVLVPTGESWNYVQAWVSCLLEDQDCPVSDFIPSNNPPEFINPQNSPKVN